MTDMADSRKARALHDRAGRELAAWLNREPRGPVAQTIALHLIGEARARLRKAKPGAGLRETISILSMKKKVLPIPGEDPSQAFYLPIKLRGEFRVEGRRLRYREVSETEDDRMLHAFGKLAAAGLSDRLRLCPDCSNFWYCHGRSDRIFCRAACRVGFWQKTDEGRKKRAAYMRGHRANPRVRAREFKEFALAGAQRKVAKSISRNLGKRG